MSVLRRSLFAIALLTVSVLVIGQTQFRGQPHDVEAGGVPDLIVQQMSIELQTGNACYTSTQLGVRVVIKNQGSATAAAPFVVDVNGNQQTVTMSLVAGATTSLWFSGYQTGTNTATVDATFVVVESNESNNVHGKSLPIPTLPAPCTPTPTPGPVGGVTELASAGTPGAGDNDAAIALLLLLLVGMAAAPWLGAAFVRRRA